MRTVFYCAECTNNEYSSALFVCITLYLYCQRTLNDKGAIWIVQLIHIDY